jgi:hypothetical protein
MVRNAAVPRIPAISIIAVAEVYISLVCSFRRPEMQMASLKCVSAARFEAFEP